MGILQGRAPQMLPDINAQSNEQYLPTAAGSASTSAGAQMIIAQSTPLIITTTATATPSPTTAPNVPASSPAAPPASHKVQGATIIAIVVPIVALLLMIPLVFFLYRSHRMKKHAQRRSSQRTSQEAMLKDEKQLGVQPSNTTSAPTSTFKGPSSTITAVPAVAKLPPRIPPPRPRRSPSSDAQRIRPSNSLGLFNFDLDSATTTADTSRAPTAPGSPPKLSVARTLQLRRSDVSIVNNSRTSGGGGNGPSPYLTQGVNPLRNNPSNGHTFDEPPPPPYHSGTTTTPQSPPQQNHFAPLNQIGTAITHPTRSKPGQMLTSGHNTPREREVRSSEDSLHAGAAPWPVPPSRQYSVSDYGHDSLVATLPAPPTAARPSTSHDPSARHSPVSPIDTYQLPGLGLGMTGRFSLSPHERRRRSEEGRSDVSGLSFDPQWLTDSHSDGRRHSGNVSPVENEDMTTTRSIL